MARRLCVLTVDDCDAVRDLISVILHHAGCEVLAASDVDGALDVVAIRTPDVILTDYRMPGLTGLDLVRTLRSRPELERTPIFLVSSESDRRLVGEVRDAGANGWVPKPVTASAILNLLQAFLEMGWEEGGGLWLGSEVSGVGVTGGKDRAIWEGGPRPI